jgi:hypothetical protein
VDDRDENDNGLFRLSENISFFSDILKNSFDTSPNSAILSSLFYIAGYCAHSLIKFVNGCENCLTCITTHSDFVINFTNCGENYSANLGEYLKNVRVKRIKHMEIGLLARPPQEPTHLLGTSQVMWKTLFIVFLS